MYVCHLADACNFYIVLLSDLTEILPQKSGNYYRLIDMDGYFSCLSIVSAVKKWYVLAEVAEPLLYILLILKSFNSLSENGFGFEDISLTILMSS